ncbi:MAG: hypothetical protein KC917_12975, partial [Candidatus Omnitrophica bacterium]|nr:hypothetical protein [Candidatus Omnitrophota bacterium]
MSEAMEPPSGRVKSLPFIVVLLAPFLLLSCSETIEEEFKDRQEVREKNYFERGWIPKNLPESAQSI